jgi:subtilase family serine protease
MHSVPKLAAMMTAAVLLVAAQAGTSSAAPRPTASPAQVTQYVKAVPVCAAPERGHSSCLAMRRVVVKPTTLGARAMTSRPAYTTGPAGGLTPGDLATAYGINASAATTVTVGIVDAFDDPNALTDLNTFDAQYSLPTETAISFKKVSQTGSGTLLPVPDPGWAGEISLDLDAVRGLCQTCKIVLVEATSSSIADLATAENEAVKLGATVITNSYGGAESGPIPASMLSAYNHPGVVITAATGDDGMFDWDSSNESRNTSAAPELPSSLSTVVAVGGTTLYLNADTTRSAETVWNENGSSDVTGASLDRAMGASGGGCSTQVLAPGWQRSVLNYAQTTCGTKRLAADIAALADPFTGYDVVDTFDTFGSPSWQTFGGTSLASPLVAAMWALAGGSGGVTYPSLSLYGHFKSDPTHSLYDVTAGGNGFCDGTPATACANYFGSPNTFGEGTLDCAWPANSTALSLGTRACDAATGYDGPSGVGTPVGVNAFKAMVPTVKVTAPATVTHRMSTKLSAVASTDPFPGGVLTSYGWTFGDGTTASTISPLVAHTYAAAGTKSLTLKITDNYGRVGSATVPVVVR